MAELRKKLSDFQQSECKDFNLDTLEDQGSKACPTCTPNPNYKTPGPWWEIKDPYLNEAECEYHARVYPYAVPNTGPIPIPLQDVNQLPNEQVEVILKYAAEKILEILGKDFNKATVEALSSLCFIKGKPYIDIYSSQIGPAFLVACPALNVDMIQDEEPEEDEDGGGSTNTPSEIVVEAGSLSRKIGQLRRSMKLYEQYYRLAQQTDPEGFVIREEENIAARISYNAVVKQLKIFKEELNDALTASGYARIQDTGFLSKKRAKEIKFVFRDNGKDYDLKKVFALADNGCMFYDRLKIKKPGSRDLTKPSFKIIFHFLANIDEIISDLTAKEPKPWAEWTIDHWYPKMILENKSDLNIDEVETGLKCLLENQLGLNSSVMDSLAREILSGFEVTQKELEKEACRERAELASGSATALAEKKSGSDPSPTEQRREAMRRRYKEEFKNQFLKHVKEMFYNTDGIPESTLSNVFTIINKQGGPLVEIRFTAKEYKVSGVLKSQKQYRIDSLERLDSCAIDYAETKQKDLEKATGFTGFGNQIQNSPHYHEAQEALTEALKSPENGAIDLFKGELSFAEIRQALSICGMTKMGKKAVNCLLGGISITDFYNLIIKNTFKFMDINIFDLFLSGLPASFLQELEEAISKEFGPGVNIVDIINVKKASNPGGAINVDTDTDYQSTNEQSAFERFTNTISISGIENEDETLPNNYQLASQKFEETALGTKVDVVFDLVLKFSVDYIINSFSIDSLIESFKGIPALDFLGDLYVGSGPLGDLVGKNQCPAAPIFYPPQPELGICDPTKSISIPKIVWPNINPLVTFRAQYSEILREKVIDLAGDLLERLVKRLVNTLESSLCSGLGIPIAAAKKALEDGGINYDGFIDAINEAFCHDSSNPDTSKSRAEELANALFKPLLNASSNNYEGLTDKIVNVISSVASTEEFLEAFVAPEGEENDQFNSRLSNAVNVLVPEASPILGDPDSVSNFFRSLGSFLSPEDRERIRNLIDSGIPNIPISRSICLTDDQLEDWNSLRKELLSQYPDPQEIVDDLNNRTRDAVDSALGDYASLVSEQGPFLAPLIDEINKDPCNPNNILNDVQQSDEEKQLESDIIDSEYDNITRIMSISFMRGNGILGHALRDRNNIAESWRTILKFIFPGYTNSQTEWTDKYEGKGRIGKFIMDQYNDGEANGVFPDTVGLKQREDILNGNIVFDFDSKKTRKNSSRNVVFKFIDEQEKSAYRIHIASSLISSSNNTFDYNTQVLERIDNTKYFGLKEEKGSFEPQLNFDTPIEITLKENLLMNSYGFIYKSNQEKNIRSAAFNSFMNYSLPVQLDFSRIYEKTYEIITNNLVEELLTDPAQADKLPAGYKFGYVSDNLTIDSYDYFNPGTTDPYNLDEEEGILGEFANPRIVALDPSRYGGSYSDPPYFVEPRQHFGWTELASKSFESQDGCDPKTPPLLDFSDIKDREKRLSNILKNDPRLSRDKECINDIPFKLLVNAKLKSKMDGVVRTTIRTYLAEYFMKGYGLFSNLQSRLDNFDHSFFLYIANHMKSNMQELGTWTSNKKIRIVRERYWYTFLEQCVEAYQRSIDVGDIVPPEKIKRALNEIQMGIDLYQNINRSTRKKMKKNWPNNTGVQKPNSNFDPIQEMSKGMVYMGYMAIAFRVSKDRENFFDGELFTDLDKTEIGMSAIKKLRFFQKIYFIRLFEKQAMLIMSELIGQELNLLNLKMVDGLTDKPHYYDLKRSFIGMKSLFHETNSNIGTNDFYSGASTEGFIPEIKDSLISPQVSESESPQLIVESYIRFIQKETTLPIGLRSLNGVTSLTRASEIIEQNIEQISENNLSDFFGNLEFTYSSSLLELFKKGYATEESIRKLKSLNSDIDFSLLKAALRSFLLSQNFEDFKVIHDSSFISEGEEVNPIGTTGSTGMKYGIRISIVLPDEPSGGYSSAQKTLMRQDEEFMSLAMKEKTFLFDEGTVVVPVASAEVDILDSTFEEFDPLSGDKRYDLACLVNKLVEQPEFSLFFEKIFNITMTSSMLAMYCIETMMPSIGRHSSEREEGYETDIDADHWDGTINWFVKNLLRQKFKSIYLNSSWDGTSFDDDDDSSREMLSFSNPIKNLTDGLTVSLPWWKRRRRKFNVRDKNGQDCADPKKDLL